ncbi:MAG: GldG family protein, partial [Desulfobulbaceae bacterium]|nr:GldG family protein [Desulfobulbaceae bacterium]
VIAQNYNIVRADLTTGRVNGNVDLLLLAAPQNLTDKERLAVDQFLMRGGAVVALAGRYSLDLNQASQSLQVKEISNGLDTLLAHYGITVDKSMVMDSHNEPFPVPVSRDLGGFTVQEIKQIPYPFFVDVRTDGMDEKSPAVANLPAVTMHWVSPLIIDPEKNKGRKVANLLRSSPDSWLHESTDIQPDFDRFPQNGFAVGDDRMSQNLAVTVQGTFGSFFADKPDPRLIKDEEVIPAADGSTPDPKTPKPPEDLPEPLLKKSTQSARLVVVGSADFVNDTVIGISRSIGQDRYLNGLEFLQNIVDWSVEDDDLLAIRSRGQHARLLAPMERKLQTFWEWLNYGLALLSLLAVSLYASRRRRRERPITLDPQET